jgi:hypothetical protein
MKIIGLILCLILVIPLHAQETDPEFEKVEETKYKVGVGMMPFSLYALSLNGRYKFNNKRELGLMVGGGFNKYFTRNYDHYFLVSYLPLKKRELIFGIDLVVSTGLYRQLYFLKGYDKHVDDFTALTGMIGIDLYYNFYDNFLFSITMNVGPLFSNDHVGITNNLSKPGFFTPKATQFMGFFELKYKIRGKSKK